MESNAALGKKLDIPVTYIEDFSAPVCSFLQHLPHIYESHIDNLYQNDM